MKGMGRRVLGALPVALALLAEGGWIAVVYELFQAANGGPMLLGPLAFAIVAGAGLVAGREGPGRLGERWPTATVALVAVTGALGWVAAAATRGALLSAVPSSALSTHPGGWLLGLAFLRGIAGARARGDDPPTGSLLPIGIAAIVMAFLFGGALPDPGRSVFRDGALPDTILFVCAGLVGLALARLRWLDAVSGLDWRRNPAWFGLMLALVAALLFVAVPASFAVGRLVVLLMAALPVPLLVVGIFAGIDRRALRILLVTIATTVVAAIVIRLLFPSGLSPRQPVQTGGIATNPTTDQAWMTVAGWLLVIVGSAILIAVLAAIWMRQARAVDHGEVGEERTIDHGGDRERPTDRRFGRRRHRRSVVPGNAPEAYLAAVEALAGHADLGRLPGETPAEHARRVRHALRNAAAPGRGTRRSPIPAALAFLAADYELARFGGRELSPREHRRGLSRWEAIQTAVRPRRATAPKPTTAGPPPPQIRRGRD
jgi:hypothetical protein